MIRIILLVIVVVLLVVAGLAVALFHFFGWKGLLAYPFVLIALVWLGKVFVSSMVNCFALGLFGMKARTLRGASMTVHAVKSVPKPAEPEPEPDTDDANETVDTESEEDGEAEEVESEAPVVPQDYFALDVTITPKGDACQSVWEPGELMLASEKIRSLADLEEKEVGTTYSVKIWNGTEFEPDDECKYEGERRLLVVFEVKPGTTRAWLHYYQEPIGELKLPAATIDV